MDVMLIFDVVIAIFGVYMIGAALKMKKTGKISSAVITAEEIARCRDDESLKMSNSIVASHFLNMCKNMERRYYKLGGNGSQLDFVELQLAATRV